ncbi:MAG: hypothetical protein LQ350_003150 [Teloschistes chrysophthalmus]|nr:MAG: hypothetical protein LQ350_003150 [Niorma chrysophthalma]
MSMLQHLLTHNQENAATTDPAVIIPGDSGISISHGQLAKQCVHLGEALAGIGIGHGTAVSLSLPNSYEFLAFFLAITTHRAIAAPLNPAYKEEEVQFYINDIEAAAIIVPKGACESGAPAVLAARKRSAAVIECCLNGETVEYDIKEKGDLEGKEKKAVEEPKEDDVALVLHTSGTTGKPKGVPLTHKNLMASVENIIQTYSLHPTDRTLTIMPLFHVHGLLASFMAPLKSLSAIILPPRLSPSFWKDFITHNATWYTATPTMHKILLSFPRPDPLPTIRFIRSCSSPLSPAALETLESAFKCPVLEAYAMTEASHQITSNPLPPAEHYPGSVGIPGPHIDLRILAPANPNNQDEESPLPPNTPGEICIRSPSITPGYLRNPAANTTAFTTPSHYFRTGDFGRLDPSTGHLYLTGRIKEFINKGGEKVSPVEVDNVMAGHEGVGECVCFAVADEYYGEDVGCAVVVREGWVGGGKAGGRDEEGGLRRVGERDLQKWMRGRVAALKVPKKIFFVTSIPKTATGKVQRKMVAEAVLGQK